ncbi:MAG: energy transducer TonB [Terriglobales bacterium]
MIWRRVATVILLLFAVTAPSFADDLGHKLQDEYKGKILLIRGFYQDNHLHYNQDGTLQGTGHAGSWTTGFIHVQKLSVKRDAVEIRGERTVQVTGGGKDLFHPLVIDDKIDIKVDETAEDETAIRWSLAKVFVGPEEKLTDLLPEYWQGFVASTENPSQTLWARVKSSDGKKRPECVESTVEKPCQVEKGVQPPKIIVAHDPIYPEAARTAKLQGTTVLWMVVDENGVPAKIRIQRAIGCGLDDQAVETVRGWRFHPATRDGKPIAVQINVEVNFRLQ